MKKFFENKALSGLGVVSVALVALGFFGVEAGAFEGMRGGPGVGDVSPEIELEGLIQAPKGAEATMESLRGKVVVIEFWATWCAPCVAAFPHLNELVEHYEDADDIVFLAITAETQETAEKLLGKKDLNTWIGFDTDGSVMSSYGVNAIPRTIIVGKDGKVAADTYPTMVTTDALDLIRKGEKADLPNMTEMMGEGEGDLEGGPEGGHEGSFGMPESMGEMNQMQMQGTAPGSEHERLDALAGTWAAKESMTPGGPMGPKLESEVTVTREWIQGGRVLFESRGVEGEAGIVQHSYYGFNREKGEYYLCEISPLAAEPTIWSGRWDEESSTIEFTRTMKIQMMGGLDQADDGEGTGQEIDLFLAIDLSEEDSYGSRLSIDLSSMGMGGKQVMSESAAVRSED